MSGFGSAWLRGTRQADLARGLDAWSAWSAKSNKHSNEACSERWAHFAGSPPGKIGAGTIFFLAKCAGWHDPPQAHVGK